MKSILIKDTTREERARIVAQSLNMCGESCDNCRSCWLGGGNPDTMYEDYVEGRKEIWEINAEYNRGGTGH